MAPAEEIEMTLQRIRQRLVLLSPNAFLFGQAPIIWPPACSATKSVGPCRRSSALSIVVLNGPSASPQPLHQFRTEQPLIQLVVRKINEGVQVANDDQAGIAEALGHLLQIFKVYAFMFARADE